MKTRSFAVYFLLLFTSIFSDTKLFAQREAGGSNDGICVPQPPPIAFKRNNGQGTCGGDAQIRLYFNQSPSTAPVLINLMYEDGTPIDYISLPVYGDISQFAKKGYIGYCLDGGNIPPAKKIIAVWHFPGSCQDDTILFE